MPVSGAAGTHRQGVNRAFSFKQSIKIFERDFVIELVERPAVKAPTALSAEDSANVQALVHRLAKPRLDPSEDRSTVRTAVWNPVSSVRIRAVESVVILAIMAYFASAALPALGLI